MRGLISLRIPSQEEDGIQRGIALGSFDLYQLTCSRVSATLTTRGYLVALTVPHVGGHSLEWDNINT